MKHARIPNIFLLTLLLAGGCAASAIAQDTPASAPSPQSSTAGSAAASAGSRSVTLQEASGPVTVSWGQPQTLPNAADYQATVADLDRNGDRVVTRAEVPPEHALSSEFNLVDRNRDGRITASELQNWR
jgi:hypothetical protein